VYPGRRSTARLTLAASGALAATVVPVFLTGALSRPMGADLGFGAAGAGVAVTGFFVAAGVGASPMARVTRRVGVRSAMRIGIAVSAIGCLVLAGLARSFWHLVLVLAVVGSVVGLVDTAAAGAFARTIRRGRQGLAFGIKEASVPVASMVAGVSVPAAAAWFGWRVAFAAIAVVLPLAWLAVPDDRRAGPGQRASAGRAAAEPTATRSSVAETTAAGLPATDASAAGTPAPGASAAGASALAASLRAIRWMALGIGAGAGAANAAATLLVPSATSAGMTAPAAGFLLATASIVSVVVRVGAGWASDRSQVVPMRWVAGALAVGALGTVLLAVTLRPALVVVGAVLTLGAGWGWTVLAFLGAIRMVPQAPARAAGVVLTGLAIGGAIGPSAFASVGARAGTAAAWWLAATAFLLGATIIAVAGRRSARL
jgi:MFS family permease